MTALRAGREGDLPALVALARATGGGLTTLPPVGEFHLFALEDTGTGEITGVGGIGARVGGFHPLHGHEIRREPHTHRPSGSFARDYCSQPVASMESAQAVLSVLSA